MIWGKGRENLSWKGVKGGRTFHSMALNRGGRTFHDMW